MRLNLTFFLFLSYTIAALGQTRQSNFWARENDTFKVCRWEHFDLIQTLNQDGLKSHAKLTVIGAKVDTHIEGFQSVQVLAADIRGLTDTLNLTVQVEGGCFQSSDRSKNLFSLNYSSESGLLEVSFLTETEDSCRLKLMDELGQEITGLTRIRSTENDIVMNLANLIVGTYYVQAMQGGFYEIEKFDLVH